jgi:dephospho-CoA kinase
LQNDNFKYAIALTGGIASGKSTVSNLFMLYGFLTIDADKIAHKLLDKNITTISKIFGDKYIKNDKVERKKLGELIFNNKDEKRKLENFLHPKIKEEIIKEASIFELQQKPYLIDIPLFFENNNYQIANSIVVYVTKEIQLQRLIKRDNLTENEAKIRINNQLDIETKKQKATFIIDNTKNLNYLQNEVEKLKNILLKGQK